MANKISTLDRIFKSSKNKNVILRKAFKELDPKTLKTFAKVMYKKFPFNDTTSAAEAIENRTINNFSGNIPDYIKAADNNSIFHYLLGTLYRNHDSITSFTNLENKFVNNLLYGSINEAYATLDSIENRFGVSFWSITQRSNLDYLNNGKSRNVESGNSYNTLDDILIKIHKNHLDEIEEGVLIEPEQIDPENIKNGIFSFFNYRVYGLNSQEQNFDIFHAIRSELNSTLIDLYKSFEMLSYITITRIYKGYEIYIYEVSEFMSSIEHYLFKNVGINTTEPDNSNSIYDSYTLGDYEYVIDVLSKEKNFDLSRFKILSKSLSFNESRLPEECFYFNQLNLMANIYSKKEAFQSSSLKLSNLNLAFRGVLIFNVIKHLINIESKGYYNETESYVLKAELLLSKDNTPLKSIVLTDSSINNDDLTYVGATASLFMETELSCDNNHDERKVKYHILRLIKDNKIIEASKCLEDGVIYKDNELSQIYIKIKSMTNEIGKACDYLLRIYIISPLAINYFITKEFYISLESTARNATTISTAICLYLCKESYVDKKMNRNATGIAIGKAIRSGGLQHPSEIQIKKEDWMCSLFLSEVCDKDLLTKSWLYRTQSEAYDERIRICNILVSNKMGNQDKLLNESKMLSKRKVLEVAEKQVNSTKIYADKDYIINNIWDQLNALYKDLREKDIEQGDILDNEIERMLNNIDLEKVDMSTVTSMGLNILPAHLIQYAALGRDYKIKTIFQMVKLYTEEYCFGLKGLNTYLSTRIRHGTLESTITSNLVSNGFMPADDNDEDKQFYSILKDTPEDVIFLLKKKRIEFKEKLYFIINEIINDWVQIRIDIPNPTIQKFNFHFDEYDLVKIARRIESSQSFNECCKYLDEFIEDKISQACLQVISALDDKSRRDILTLFDDFEGYLYDIQSENSYNIPFEFNRLVTSSKQHVLNQLDVIINWFKLNQDFHEESYDMEVITGIIKNMVQIEKIKVIDFNKIKITYDILSAMVDIVYNLVNNAIKYSNLHPSEVNIEIECSVDIMLNKVSIEVKNDCALIENYKEKNLELKKYSASISSEDLKNLMQREGGNTGIARVKSAIRYELNAREEVSLYYISDKNFSATASFRNARGLSYDQNINN